MGIQVVVKTDDVNAIERALGNISGRCEVFPVSIGHFGVSIPTSVVDSAGEQVVIQKLEKLHHFDLWAGIWKSPKPKWKLW